MTERLQRNNFSIAERIPTLGKDGFTKVSSFLTDEEVERVIERIYLKNPDRDLSVIKGKVRERITDEKSKWKKATYIFDSNSIEALMVESGVEIGDENYNFMMTYLKGYPVLYTSDGTVLLRPKDRELRQTA